MRKATNNVQTGPASTGGKVHLAEFRSRRSLAFNVLACSGRAATFGLVGQLDPSVVTCVKCREALAAGRIQMEVAV